MGIVDHPGFLQAIGDEGFTASEATVLLAAIEAVEEWLAGCSQSQIASALSPSPSRPDQVACPTFPETASETCIASELRRTLRVLSSGSSPSPAPFAEMTAGEFLRSSHPGVHPASKQEVA